MKRISKPAFLGQILALLCTFLGFGGSADAGAITWETDLSKAAAESQRSQKPMLVKFTASWCGYCRKMTRHTFSDANIAKRVNACFIPVSVDADANQKFANAAGIKGLLPTTVIISPELVVLKRITGYQTPRQFEKQIAGLCRRADHANIATGKRVATTTGGARNSERGTRSEQDSGSSAPNSALPGPSFAKHCLVSMRDDRKVRKGTPAHTSQFRGRTVCFTSADYKRRFDANPEKYWPAADGACAVAARDLGETRPGSPKFAVIYRRRLWFFSDAEHRRHFSQQPASYAPTTK